MIHFVCCSHIFAAQEPSSSQPRRWRVPEKAGYQVTFHNIFATNRGPAASYMNPSGSSEIMCSGWRATMCRRRPNCARWWSLASCFLRPARPFWSPWRYWNCWCNVLQIMTTHLWEYILRLYFTGGNANGLLPVPQWCRQWGGGVSVYMPWRLDSGMLLTVFYLGGKHAEGDWYQGWSGGIGQLLFLFLWSTLFFHFSICALFSADGWLSEVA